LTLHDDLLNRSSGVDGHADVWRLFSDGALLRRIVAALAEPFREATKVAGVEARGFILGGAVATELGVGFVAIRKEAGLFPGDKISRRAQVDYRGTEHTLRLQRAALAPTDRVILVDDWAERGARRRSAGGRHARADRPRARPGARERARPERLAAHHR
jgi:adenine phosphoribosyltransferase